MAHLVDTDVLIDLATNNQGAIVYVNSLTEGWSVSIITALELIVGARDKKEITKIDKFLTAVPIVPLTPGVGQGLIGTGQGTPWRDERIRHGAIKWRKICAHTAVCRTQALGSTNSSSITLRK
jgi:hypothetical protein